MSKPGSTTQRWVQVYVASPITHVSDEAEQRKTLNECDAIVATVTEFAGDYGRSIEAYDPIHKTPNFQHELVADDGTSYTPREIWDIDTTKVLEHADAIVVNGAPGGSTGVGIELALAFGRGLPVLYLWTADRPVTRMVSGMPGFLELAEFDRDDPHHAHLREVVLQWLLKWEPLMAAGPARRNATVEHFTPLQTDLLRRWGKLDREQRVLVMDRVQLHHDGIEHYLRQPGRLASMPAVKLDALTLALGRSSPFLSVSTSRPLTSAMSNALRLAAREYGWGQSFTESVREQAELHMDETSRRRQGAQQPARAPLGFDFTQRGDWLRFYETWRSGGLS